MKNRQSEVIIDNDSQKVVDLNKANKSSAYFKIFLFLALGLILTSLVTVGFSYLFTNLLFGSIDETAGLIWFFVILFVSFIGAFLSSFFVTKSRLVTKKTSTSLISYLLYTFFIGIFLASFVLFIDDPTILGITLLTTSILVLSMGIIAYLSKGKGLFMVAGVISILVFGIAALYLLTFFLFPLFIVISAPSMLWIFFIVECILFASILIYTAIDFFMIKKEIEARNNITNSDCLYFSLVIYSDFVRIFIQLLRLLIILFFFVSHNFSKILYIYMLPI